MRNRSGIWNVRSERETGRYRPKNNFTFSFDFYTYIVVYIIIIIISLFIYLLIFTIIPYCNCLSFWYDMTWHDMMINDYNNHLLMTIYYLIHTYVYCLWDHMIQCAIIVIIVRVFYNLQNLYFLYIFSGGFLAILIFYLHFKCLYIWIK